MIEGDLEETLNRLVDETSEYAACFKPNIAYFEALGSEGYALLERLVARIPDEIPVLLDAKRGDIGATQDYYAKAYFERMDVDAVTLNAFMGFDAIEPFLKYPGTGCLPLGGHIESWLRRYRIAEDRFGALCFRTHSRYDRTWASDAGLPGEVGLVDRADECKRGGDLEDRRCPAAATGARGAGWGRGESRWAIEAGSDAYQRVAGRCSFPKRGNRLARLPSGFVKAINSACN